MSEIYFAYYHDKVISLAKITFKSNNLVDPIYNANKGFYTSKEIRAKTAAQQKKDRVIDRITRKEAEIDVSETNMYKNKEQRNNCLYFLIIAYH